MASDFTQRDHLLEYLTAIYTKPANKHIKNAPTLRLPVLAEHPLIRPINSLILEALYAQAVFGCDVRSLTRQLIADDDIRQAIATLVRSPHDIAVLSTYAVNTLYIADRFYFGSDVLDPQDILSHAELLDMSDPEQRLLYFYYVTHCVIGESLFYSRPLPKQHLAVYTAALRKLDAVLMSDAFEDLHLDIKFEVLVCAKMCGIRLASTDNIYQQALQSLSPQGDFIIDTAGAQAQTGYATLSSAEHRNVLFLMSCVEYAPASPLTGVQSI